ncbi:Uncharacterised protein [Burkholderia pseudomallei]|nr:Uncharacterised protein [Burkholderia pseudomallei]CAJ3649587.1 Uncharacterised protein [Burkholderia pseudomallei]CAJ5268996.1 Uncharacterised protein [Burkholderia pseudomallei]CAJ5320687.1 Uncharacterised protein [Burkholderia pseudomallei]CAJ5541851.1 Uncharacterised protein [Burkholderia pseudomallei]
MGLRPRVRVAWVAGFALSPVAQAAPRAVERIDAGPAPRPCAGSPARAPRASRGSGFFDVTRPLRFCGSAVLRFCGSAARRLGGSAVRRFGGSAVRRFGGSAARRRQYRRWTSIRKRSTAVAVGAVGRHRETVRAAQYPRRHGMRCIRRAAGRRAAALAPDLRARRERTTAARWPHGQPRDTDIVTRRRRAHRAPARRSLRAHGETPRRRPAHPRTTRCAAAPHESRRGSRRCSTRRECAP